MRLFRKALLFCFCFCFILKVTTFANPWKNLSNGDQVAQELLHQMETKTKEAGTHPFSVGISQEAHLSVGALEGASQSLAQKNPVGQMIIESSESRPKVKIDAEKDPLMVGSQRILENPLEAIGGTGTQLVKIPQAIPDEIFVCEEPGDDSLETCKETLNVRVIKTKVLKEKSGSFYLSGCKKSYKKAHPRACLSLLNDVLNWRNILFWKRNPGIIDITQNFKLCLQETLRQGANRCPKCENPRNRIPIDLEEDRIKSVVIERRPSGTPLIKGGAYYNTPGTLKNYNLLTTIKVVYEEDSYHILPDEWGPDHRVSNCERLEEKVDQGLCSYVSRECSQGPQTRLIAGIPITRDCWEQTLTYSCSYPAQDDCGPLRARGCAQINSTCAQMIGSTCVVYTQTYQCQGNTNGVLTEGITGGHTPFCLDGNCRDQSWESNDEMMSTLAQLSLLKEMQGKMNSIFKGEGHQCSKHILNFKDCCGSGKGWGKSVGLGGCKAKEKLLHEKRKKRLCHYVGTYCAEKILGKCIKKKSSFCCFGSKLLKVFHEQGRKQIKLGWGEADEPLCRGFTIEEIQRIDFSKLDLREAFEDLIKNYKPEKIKDMGEKIGERLDTIKQGLSPHPTKQPQQRPEA